MNEQTNELINAEKSPTSAYMPTISVFLSQANRAYSTLSSQLEAVINEVSMAHNLIITVRLKISPW